MEQKSAFWNHLVSIHSLIYLRNTGSSVDFFDLFQKGITAQGMLSNINAE